jgi:hypothetical protein
MRSNLPQRREVPFFVDVGIALALTLTVSFFILVMEVRFGVTGIDPDQMPLDHEVIVAHDHTSNKHN